MHHFTLQDEELKEMIQIATKLDANHGHYFDHVLENEDLQKTVNDLILCVQRLESEPQWVPASWVREQ